MNVQDIRNYFIEELENERFTTDKTGAKTIELLGASFAANEPSVFGEVNQQYVEAEIAWYLSNSLNVNDIYTHYGSVPQAWQYTANYAGEINSNYGYLINSKDQHDQFSHCVSQLLKDQDTRRAIMIYTRPSMQHEFAADGKNDFVCTNSVSYYIRDNKMRCVVQMRSNDVVYGYKNDYAWQRYVLRKLTSVYNDLSDSHVQVGDIHWQVQNLHVYEKHFGLVQ